MFSLIFVATIFKIFSSLYNYVIRYFKYFPPLSLSLSLSLYILYIVYISTKNIRKKLIIIDKKNFSKKSIKTAMRWNGQIWFKFSSPCQMEIY